MNKQLSLSLCVLCVLRAFFVTVTVDVGLISRLWFVNLGLHGRFLLFGFTNNVWETFSKEKKKDENKITDSTWFSLDGEAEEPWDGTRNIVPLYQWNCPEN